jgi:hypothetical protein
VEKVHPGAFAGFGGQPALTSMTPSFEWRSSHALDRTRRSHDEVVPHDAASLAKQPFAYNRSNPGPHRPLSQHAVSNVFPTPASRDEGKFLPMPGIGLKAQYQGPYHGQHFDTVWASGGVNATSSVVSRLIRHNYREHILENKCIPCRKR